VTVERSVLLVGGTTAGVRDAKALGLHVVLLQHHEKFQLEQADLADELLLVDYTDWDLVRPLVQALHAARDFGAALSLTEVGLATAGRVNDLLGLGGTGWEVSNRLRDKWTMRRHLADAAGPGTPTVGAEPLSDRDGLAAFGKRFGYPFIVKPTNLFAGFGVLRVHGPDDLDRIWARVRELRESGVTRGPRIVGITDFLCEEYVGGPEFSVEGFSFGGRHVLIAVTEKLIDESHFAELGHTLPARLDAGTEDAIRSAVTGFLDVIGLRDGPSHTEVRVGPRGPVVIEGHSRPGGDRIGDLLAAVYGVDLGTLATGWPFGLVDELPDRPVARGGGCVRFLHGPAGRVTEVSGFDPLRGEPGVLVAEASVRVGDVVRPLEDNWDRLGLVAVRGPDSAAAVARCEDLVRTAATVRTAAEPEGTTR
jgi:biotin carboxylase